MWTPKPGDVVPYTYLWWREHEAGEESGRKVRPCVVVVAVRSEGGEALRVAVAAVSHVAPDDRAAVEMPLAVKRSLGLDSQRSWVICDEINHFQWPGFDFGRTPSGARAFGRIPDALLQKVKKLLADTRTKTVNRD